MYDWIEHVVNDVEVTWEPWVLERDEEPVAVVVAYGDWLQMRRPQEIDTDV